MITKEELTIAPQRSVRVEDELWLPVKALCEERDDTISQVIRRGLVDYLRTGGVVDKTHGVC